MNDESGKNRFGHEAKTNIPKDAPLASQPGHRLRTSNIIVDRKALDDKGKPSDLSLKDSKNILKEKLARQEIELVNFEDQVGVIRQNQNDSSRTGLGSFGHDQLRKKF